MSAGRLLRGVFAQSEQVCKRGMSSYRAGARCGNPGTTALGEVVTPSWSPTKPYGVMWVNSDPLDLSGS
jgi:hypothetical protein